MEGTDAAGVQEGTLAPPVVEGLVGVAEEEAVQPPLLSEIARLQEGGLHPQAVAVAEVEPQPLQDQGLLLRLAGSVVAVALDLVEGDVRVMAVEVPGVVSSVPQVEDPLGADGLHGGLHGAEAAVGIREH